MSPKHSINIRGEMIDLSSPKVMGIINVTPDSFFEESRKGATKEIIQVAEKMLEEGATFLDIGGYSSRPGATDISVEEELDRVIDPIKTIVDRFPEAIISIDTFRSEVARQAVDVGASLVNDISAGHLDDQMLFAVAELGVPYVAMHMKGTPQTTKELTKYDDLLHEAMKYFSSVLDDCNRLGIKDVIIDPGFGFAKTAEQSFDLLGKLDHFHHLDRPLLVGVSRKSMIYRTLNSTAEEALNGTTVLNTVALLKGAQILRVHDVRETVEAIKLVNELS
ncbi:dihydropteroate synthase [Ekhidna sp.]|uniref:dihydropteroate synthase n=1 Tax=Ekhidna sp. TaxID=2608089 RepID=UPI003C7C4EB0